MVSIPPSVLVIQQPTQVPLTSSPIEVNRTTKEPGENESCTTVLIWINNGTKKGLVEDNLGNKFIPMKKIRGDDSIGYRCETLVGHHQEKKRCKAVARRHFEPNGEQKAILLEYPHDHEAPTKRKSTNERQPTSGNI